MKTCKSCNKRKTLSEFGKLQSSKDGLNCYCKKCKREKSKKYYQNNIDKYREYDKKRYKRDKEKRLQANKMYRQANSELVNKNERNRYHADNDRIRAVKNDYHKNRQSKDINYRLVRVIRRHVQRIKEASVSGKMNTSNALEIKKFKKHIEDSFKTGMSWENYGEWHIDHIKPISQFVNEGITDPDIINNLSNLQPLWAKENISKGGCKLIQV